MKKNELGFGIVGLLVILVVVAITGAIGWLVWSRLKATPQQQPTQSTNTNQNTDKKAMESIDTLKASSIKKISPLTLTGVSDVVMLPDYTPSSFKDYVREDFQNDTSCVDKSTLRYTIEAISADTLAGSRLYCGEGFGIVWYLDGSGKWNSVGQEDACTGKNDGSKLSAEFMKIAMHDTCSAFAESKY